MTNPFISLTVVILIIVALHYLFWPEKGLYWRWRKARLMSERILIEDALKHIHNYEIAGDRPTIDSIAGALQVPPKEAAELVAKIETSELATREGTVLRLTPNGRRSAVHILRAHRLWERYLADATGFSEDEWHSRADEFEHMISPTEADALHAQLGHPTYDPHGDPIPSAEGEMIQQEEIALTSADLNTVLRISHIEDEPETIYAQLVAEGLHPGMIVQLTEITPQRVRFWTNGDEHLLAPIVASNIFVVPIPEVRPVEGISKELLSDLDPGARGEVIAISPACRGIERRRLLDLGFLPGTVIQKELTNPNGDPSAYRIRGALIALREEQSDLIHIRTLETAQ
jgi:DtxR family Mn-dependent transcriptional regulator